MIVLLSLALAASLASAVLSALVLRKARHLFAETKRLREEPSLVVLPRARHRVI